MQAPNPEESPAKKQKLDFRPLNLRSPTVSSSSEEEEEEVKEVVPKLDDFLLPYARPRPRPRPRPPPPPVEDIRSRWFRITAPSGGKPYVHIPLVPDVKLEPAANPFLRAARRQREPEPMQPIKAVEPASAQSAAPAQHNTATTPNANEKSFRCSECQYTSSEVGNLRRHLTQTGHKDLAGVAVGPYLCQECSFASSRYDTMQTHLRTMHSQGKASRDKLINKLGRWTDEVSPFVTPPPPSISLRIMLA